MEYKLKRRARVVLDAGDAGLFANSEGFSTNLRSVIVDELDELALSNPPAASPDVDLPPPILPTHVFVKIIDMRFDYFICSTRTKFDEGASATPCVNQEVLIALLSTAVAYIYPLRGYKRHSLRIEVVVVTGLDSFGIQKNCRHIYLQISCCYSFLTIYDKIDIVNENPLRHYQIKFWGRATLCI